MQGFPCRCDLTSSTEGPATEGEVRGREGEGGREGRREGRRKGRKEGKGGREGEVMLYCLVYSLTKINVSTVEPA